MAIGKDQISEQAIEEVGERITFVRLTHGLKQSDFCERIGISKGNLSDLENSRYKPSFQAIFKIISHFNVSPLWLISGEGSPFDSNYDYSGKDNYLKLFSMVKSSAIAKNIMEDTAVLKEINEEALKDVKDFVRFKLKTEIDKRDRRKNERRFTHLLHAIPGGIDRRRGKDRRKIFL